MQICNLGKKKKQKFRKKKEVACLLNARLLASEFRILWIQTTNSETLPINPITNNPYIINQNQRYYRCSFGEFRRVVELKRKWKTSVPSIMASWNCECDSHAENIEKQWDSAMPIHINFFFFFCRMIHYTYNYIYL